jgi:hypothetical protein
MSFAMLQGETPPTQSPLRDFLYIVLCSLTSAEQIMTATETNARWLG